MCFYSYFSACNCLRETSQRPCRFLRTNETSHVPSSVQANMIDHVESLLIFFLEKRIRKYIILEVDENARYLAFGATILK